MKRLALVLLLLFAGAPRAQSVAPADQAAIQAVVAAQLDAFRRDDETAAFGYASPMIQGMFETPTRFMDMVRGPYRPIYRPRLVEFGEIIEVEGRPVQKVEIIGPDGTAVLALYTMIRRPEGWRIDGVALTASEKFAA